MLSSFFPISLTHLLTHSLACLLSAHSLACTFSCFLVHYITVHSLIGFLSALFTDLLNRLLPHLFTHGPFMYLLPPFLTRFVTHTHTLACLHPSVVTALSCSLFPLFFLTRSSSGLFLPPSITSYRTILLACFMFSSILCYAPSLVCFVFDSLTHSSIHSLTHQPT